MFGPMAQNWRQIMQMPQQAPQQGGMPTQNASGGWMMPRQQMQAPQMPPVSQPMASPMMGQPPQDWRQMMPNYFHDWNSSFSGR